MLEIHELRRKTLCRIGWHGHSAAFSRYSNDETDFTFAYVVCPYCGKRPQWVLDIEEEQRRRLP